MAGWPDGAEGDSWDPSGNTEVDDLYLEGGAEAVLGWQDPYIK